MVTGSNPVHGPHQKPVMSITIGTEVVLKAYTTAQCPPCPFDSTKTAAVDKHYTVIGNSLITDNGVTYSILSVERINANDPGPGLYWPELYVKLALPH